MERSTVAYDSILGPTMKQTARIGPDTLEIVDLYSGEETVRNVIDAYWGHAAEISGQAI
ncbi:MAG: hypothetical protein IPK19_41840 [Chloroflexi bacterium]|nr:hypothetical protein [Chloroflexota bacterium]